MKKTFYTSVGIFAFITTIVSIIAVVVCLFLKKEDDEKLYLDYIEVYSFAENEQGAYHIYYPKYIEELSEEGNGAVTRRALTNKIMPDQLTQEQIQFVINYLNNNSNYIEEGEATPYAYKVVLRAHSEKEGNIYINIKGIDEFPVGWDEFISFINKICGENSLKSGNIQKVTPQLLTELYGVTNADLQKGNLNDMIASMAISMMDLMEGLDINKCIEEYEKRLELPPQESYLIRINQSTDAEFEAFVEEYIGVLNNVYDFEKGSGECPGVMREFVRASNHYANIFIGRTQNFQDECIILPFDEDEEKYTVSWHYGEFTCGGFVFYYSADYKYFLVADDRVDQECIDAFLLLGTEQFATSCILGVLEENKATELITLESTQEEYEEYIKKCDEEFEGTELGYFCICNDVTEPLYYYDVWPLDAEEDYIEDDFFLIGPSSYLTEETTVKVGTGEDEHYRVLVYYSADRTYTGNIEEYDFIYVEGGKFFIAYPSHYGADAIPIFEILFEEYFDVKV